jgi:hypothetical protein
MAHPAHAQLEPEAFTILKVALSSHPPDPHAAAMILHKYNDAADREKLQVTWLEMLANKATGKVEEKRKKLADLFDAFQDSFAAGDSAKQRAKTFIKLRDELLARNTSDNRIEQSASDFVAQLRTLPDADRRVLQEFGKAAKGRIKSVVKESEKGPKK